MVERISVQPIAQRRSDEKESTLPLTIPREHGRHRRQFRVISVGQTVAMRIFSRRRPLAAEAL